MKHEFEVIELQPQAGLTIREKVANAEIPAKMGEFFGEIAGFAGRNGIPLLGPPFALYHSWNDRETEMEVGFPVPPGAIGEGRVRPMALPGGRVVTGLHIGPYDKLVDTYGAMGEWMKVQGHVPAALMWETYLSDPAVEKDPAKWITRMYWPIA
jgi:effector-binding domain-containing protein